MKNFLRWIALLPGSLLAVVAVYWFVYFICSFWDSAWLFNILHLHTLSAYLFQAFESLLSPIVFVMTGIYIAPYRKNFTAWLMLGISVIVPIGMLLAIIFYSSANEPTSENYIFVAFNTLGCIIAYMFFPEPKSKKSLQVSNNEMAKEKIKDLLLEVKIANKNK